MVHRRGRNYQYDAEGNMVRMTKIADGRYWTYTFSHNNQVTSAKLYDVNSANSVLQKQTDYGYDIFG